MASANNMLSSTFVAISCRRFGRIIPVIRFSAKKVHCSDTGEAARTMKRMVLLTLAVLLTTVAPPQLIQARAAISSPGGVVLDGYGGLHPFGGLQLTSTSAPYWQNWDIARSVAVLSDGSGGWTLDGFGGIHSWGAAPAIVSPVYWANWDVARALVVAAGGASGYVLDAFGGLHPFGSAPSFSGTPYWPNHDFAHGLDIYVDASGTTVGGAILDAGGGLHMFGSYPLPLASTIAPYPNRMAFQALHDVSGHVYAVGRFGKVVEETSGSPMTPNWSGYSDLGIFDHLRDIDLTSSVGGAGDAQPMSFMASAAWQEATGPRGGVVLDGFGGIHAFGGLALNTLNSPYWPYWDIARSLAAMADASGGWTLDGFGGLHPWGSAPNIAAPAYWPNWDIARALVVNPQILPAPGPPSGYVLDGFGGLHSFGGAPPLTGFSYWPNWDVARGLVIHYTDNGVPDGGWTLDAFGGVHAFGAATSLPAPTYFANRDIYQRIHQLYNGDTYTVSRWGVVDNVTGGQFAPFWFGYEDWGSWDILRDVVLFGDDNQAPSAAQPVSDTAANAYWSHVWVWRFAVNPVQQGLPLDCESAAMEEAMAAKGREISQYTIFSELPNDPRAATWVNGQIYAWGDPYSGFIGSANGSIAAGTGYGVYDPPLAGVARQNGFNAVGIEGGTPQQVFNYLAIGDPVVIITSDTFSPVATQYYWAYDEVNRLIPWAPSEHAVTIVAEDGVTGTITLDDVGDGRMKTFTMSQFATFWTSFLDMAVALT